MRLLSKKKAEINVSAIRAAQRTFIQQVLRGLGRNVARPLGIAKSLLQTSCALHALLPVFGGAHLFRLGEFGRGFVELLFPFLHGCRVSSFNGLGKDDFFV